MTTDAPSSALDQILEAARGSLHARHAETLDRGSRVRAALEAYVNALAAEIASDFAAKNGLPPVSAGQSPIGAALALRAAVEALPELRSRANAPPAPASSPSPSAPSSASPPSSGQAQSSSSTPTAESPPVRPRTIVTTTSNPNVVTRRHEDDDGSRHGDRPRSSDVDPITVALIRDIQSLDLAKMPQHQFRIWAEELAARARSLQDKGADPDSVPGRVIRKLTAIAYEKGIGDVFGLNRKHTANWDEVAERARVRREQAIANASAAAEKAAEKAAQKKEAPPPPEPKPKAPPPPPPPPVAEEAPPSSNKVAAAPKEAAPESGKLQTPLLRNASRRNPVVFVGGVVKQEKVALIRQKYGIDIEWVDTSRHGTQAVAGVEKRIRERRLSAVVVLQGLIGHKHFEPLVAAARHVATPFAYADKAGLGSVQRAFTELEKQMNDQATDRTG